MKTFLNATHFIFRNDSGTTLGRADFETLTLKVEGTPTQTEQIEMEIAVESYFPGEEIVVGNGRPTIVLGPKKDRPLLVILNAVGNPDRQQYARIGPKLKISAADIEEAQKIVKRYQNAYDMGGGNCAKDHGSVYEKGEKRNKLIGRVFYNGKYETLAETKKWEAECKAKYAKA